MTTRSSGGGVWSVVCVCVCVSVLGGWWGGGGGGGLFRDI